MKKTIAITVMAAITGLFITSCQTSSDVEGFRQTESGLLYKFVEKGDNATSPEETNILTLSMTYGSADSIVFDSKKSPMPMELPLMKSVHKGDLYEGLAMMHVGDSAIFKCNADSVFTKLFRLQSPPAGLESADFIYFNVKLLDFNSQEAIQAAREAEMEMLKSEEEVKRNTYLDEHYPNAQQSASGLYYVQLKKGNGIKPEAGKKVKVHYTGTLLDGTKFDSSLDKGQPFEFQLGQGRVIKGWDEGIANMSKGEKGVLIVPSDLAYGPGNRGIPPFSTLVFEVELVDF